MQRLESITVKNFRCFSSITIAIDQPIVVINGDNGSGKTSLLEALHYACYLRSFRTHISHDLIQEGADSFFVKAVIRGSDSQNHEVQVGFADKKRLVKLDQRPVTTYKELLDIYRIVTMTEDDLGLIRGGPELRRSFIDQVCLFMYPEYAQSVRNFRKVMYARNALLKKGHINKEMYELWSMQLWKASHVLVTQRVLVLKQLEEQVRWLVQNYFNNQFTIKLTYQPSADYQSSYEDFASSLRMADEMRYGRSLFGAHLDDIAILFQEHSSRSHASRGQQKLVILLIKMAQIKLLKNCIVLIDDFMADFDQQRIIDLIAVLVDLENQLVFTIPLLNTPLSSALEKFSVQNLSLNELTD